MPAAHDSPSWRSQTGELSALKEKIMQLSQTDAAKEVLSKGGNMTRELSLLKTELKMLKIQHESEVRKRTTLEAQLLERSKELDELKKRRGEAAAVVEQKRAEMERSTKKLAMENRVARIEREVCQANSLSLACWR